MKNCFSVNFSIFWVKNIILVEGTNGSPAQLPHHLHLMHVTHYIDLMFTAKLIIFACVVSISVMCLFVYDEFILVGWPWLHLLVDLGIDSLVDLDLHLFSFVGWSWLYLLVDLHIGLLVDLDFHLSFKWPYNWT